MSVQLAPEYTTLLKFRIHKPMDAHLFISDEEGNIRFTRAGREYLKPIFELADINLNEIRTIKAYKLARKQVSSYFMQHLANRASGWPDT